MPLYALPLTPRDQRWLVLRDRLARAARDMHFSAVSSDAMNGAAMLVIAGNLASLALSIPVKSASDMAIGPVEASTLLATQILQLDQSL